MKAIEVLWLDAHSEVGWQEPDKLDVIPKLTKTIGFFIKETSDFVIVSHTWDESTKHLNGAMYIPKGMIKKRRFVCLSKLKTEK